MAWKKTNKTARQVSEEIMADITDKFVKCLEQGKIPWKESWNRSNSGFLNSQGKSYSFMNTLMLVLTGCSEGEFVTLNEIADRTQTSIADGSVWACFNKVDGKVPKSHHVYFYKMVEYTKKGDDGKPMLDKDGNEVTGRYPILKSSNVWQVGKEVNCPLKFNKKVEKKEINPIAECENVVVEYQARENIEIRTENTTPAYSISGDYIHMPERNLFDSAEAYYGDLFHEMAHSTGATKRLNRDLAKMDKQSYSFEELVAEISSCAILHDKGFNTESTDKNSVAYIQGWARALNNNPAMVEKACRMATKAVNYIYNGKE